jgi:hypothetical protein
MPYSHKITIIFTYTVGLIAIHNAFSQKHLDV